MSQRDAIGVINGIDTVHTKTMVPVAINLKKGQHILQFFELNGEGRLDTIIQVNDFRQEVLKFGFQAKRNSQIIEERDIAIKGSLVTVATTSPENSLAFSFLRGDRIEIEIQMENKKGKNFLKILSYPDDNTVFNARKFQDLDEAFTVPADGIYVFQLSSNHAFDRQAKIKISRIPSENSPKRHNTHVKWEVYYDAISIHDAESFYVNSGSNAALMGGKSRVFLPIKLPKDTKKWFYEFGAFRKESDAVNAEKSFDLVGQLSYIADPSGLLSVGVDLLTQPPGAEVCDLYLLDSANVNSFVQKVEFSYVAKASRENYKSGIVEVDGDLQNAEFYLGIKNPSSTAAIHVILEVVAIVEKGRWVKAE